MHGFIRPPARESRGFLVGIVPELLRGEKGVFFRRSLHFAGEMTPDKWRALCRILSSANGEEVGFNLENKPWQKGGRKGREIIFPLLSFPLSN